MSMKTTTDKSNVKKLTVHFRGSGGGHGCGRYNLTGYDDSGTVIYSDTRSTAYQLWEIRGGLQLEFPNATISEK